MRADDSVGSVPAQAPDAENSRPDGSAARLAELERVVEEGLETFVKVGEALREIRDKRLYREQHATFEDYCQQRWGWGRRHANRHVEAAEIAKTLGSIDPATGTLVPGVRNVGQARAIAPLYREDPEKAGEVMRGLLAEHGEDLTASKIVEAVGRELHAHPAAGDEQPTADAIVRKEDGAEPTQPDRPETYIFRGGDLPAPADALAEAMGGGRAMVLTCDMLASGKGVSLTKVRSFVDAAVRTARDAQRDAHLLLLCSSDLRTIAAVERTLRRPAPRRKPPRDRIAAALSTLTSGIFALSSVSRVLEFGRGFVVSRETKASAEASLDHRLAVRRGNVRLSVPCSEETVSGLTETTVVRDLAAHFKGVAASAAAAGGPVRFSTPEPGRLTVAGGTRSLSLPGSGEDHAPMLPSLGGGSECFGCRAGALSRVLARVLPYTASDHTRPVLAAVRIEAHRGGARLAATDSYRLITDDSLVAAAPPRDVTIPAGDLRSLARLLALSEPDARVDFAYAGDDEALVVVSGAQAGGTTFEVACRPLDAPFPEYRRLLPDEGDLARFGLPRREALVAAKAVAALAGSPAQVLPVRVEFEGQADTGEATISYEADGRAFAESMPAVVPRDAPVRAACINPDFFVDALEVAHSPGSGDTVWLGINQRPSAGESIRSYTERTGATLRPVMVGADVLLMPMRCPEDD